MPEILTTALLPIPKALKNYETKDNALRIKRILQDLKSVLNNKNPEYEVYPYQNDIGFWRVVMKGPLGGPYESGAWLIYVMFPIDYPFSPPEIRFETPILHCNINPYGKVCHSILGRNWTSDTNMFTVLNCVYGLLLFPETADPIDTLLAFQFFSNKAQYEKNIVEYIKNFSIKTFEKLKEEVEAKFVMEQEMPDVE